MSIKPGSRWSRAERVEWAAIAIAAAAAWTAARAVPPRFTLGEAILACAAFVMLQTLARDLWIRHATARSGDRTAQSTTVRPGACMCLESILGLSGIAAGCAVALWGPSQPLNTPAQLWPTLALILGITGFLLKDRLVDWRTCTIRTQNNLPPAPPAQ